MYKVGGLSFLAGALLCFVVSRWPVFCLHSLPGKFYEVRFVECVQLLLTLVIALFVTYFLNRRFQQGVKVLELFLARIKDFKELSHECYSVGSMYIVKRLKSDEVKIIVLFKKLNTATYNIYQLSQAFNKSQLSASLKNTVALMKRTVTSSPYGRQTEEFPPDAVKKFENAYEKLNEIISGLEISILRDFHK